MKNKIKITNLAGADIQIVGDVNVHCKLDNVQEIKINASILSDIVDAAVRDKYFGELLQEMIKCPEFEEVLKSLREV